MNQIRGWTLVAIWLTVAMFMLFLDAIFPAVKDWLRVNQHLSGWAQAIGGLLAVLAVWLVARMQANAALAVDKERDRQMRVRHFQAAHLRLSNAAADLERLGRLDIFAHGGVLEVPRACRQIADDLGSPVGPELPSVIASHLSTGKAMLLEFAAIFERLGVYTNREQDLLRQDLAAIRQITLRGRNLCWALIERFASQEELREERSLRDALLALQDRRV
jgi:hypothetical protein